MTTRDNLELQVRLKAATRDARRAESRATTKPLVADRACQEAWATLYRLRFEISIAIRRPLGFSE